MKNELNEVTVTPGLALAWRWPWLALCALLALACPVSADVLYENTAERADPERFAQSGFEFGEEIILAGPGTHTVTNFQYEFFGYGGDFNSNLVQVALRFYRNDGPAGVPGTLLYDSGFYSIPATPSSGSVITYGGLNVAVPRSFTWTVEFQGLSTGGAGLQAGGLDLYRLPTVGQTYDDYWERSGAGGTWALRAPAPGQPAINFGCLVSGDYAGSPVITRQPRDQVGRLGQGAEFSVVAIGTAPLTYQWQRGGTNLPGATQPVLTLTNLAFTDGLAYSVIVANSLGSVTSAPARLLVDLPLLYDNTSQRADPERFAEMGYEFGEEILLAGNGTAYVVTNFLYEFFGYGADFTNGNVSVALRFYANDGPAGVPGTLIFDSGYSPIPPTGNAGSVISYGGLSVSVPRNFTWTVEFQGLTSGGAGLQGGGLDLYGVPSIGQTYDDYWERSGPGGTWQLRVPGPGQPAINFGCQVVGLYSGPPFLTQLPRDQSVFEGRPATFTAFALGTAPVSYQWRKGGNPIAGATNNFLVLPQVAFSDAGNYSVQAANAFGTATSPNAILTVLPPDAEPPVAHCPTNITVGTVTGACTNTVSFSATATDNYPDATVVCSPASGSGFAQGTTTVTCVATDAYGNTNACSFTVTVVDQEAPVIGACPAAVTVGMSVGSCASNVTYTAPSATDNCTPAPTVVCSPASGSAFSKGTNLVTCVATDGSGNTNTCSFKVVVQDQWNPVMGAVPTSVTVGTSPGSCASNVTYAVPSATDNCTPAPTVVCSPASGSAFSKGTTVVTCVATDGSGNTHTRTFTVTVQDRQPPALGACPANLTVGTSNVTYVAPSATDNCTPAPTVACVPASGTPFPVGSTTVICTATDGSGNTNACTFVVTVNSNPPPGPPALVRLDFNENTGTFAANRGTLGGLFTLAVPVPIWTTNAPPGLGTAIDFGTTTGNYGVDSPGVLTGLGNLPRFTITGWLNNRSSTTGSGGNRIVRHFISGGHGIDLVYRSDGSLDMGVNAFANSAARSSGSRITTSAAASPGNWRFFAVTYDSTVARDNVRYYFGSPTVNATFDRAASVAAGPVGPNIGMLTIGAVNPPARPTTTDRMFRGLIDNVAIFDSVLSPADILNVQRERPTVSIAAIDASASEPGLDTGLFRLSRNGPTATPLTVSLLWDGTAVNGVDYQLQPNSVVIPAGAATVDITVVPIDDAVYDPEIVTLTVLPATAYGVGVPGTASLVLSDNDVQTFPVPLVRLRLNEGTGTSTANAGSLGGFFTRTTPVPAWTTNRPPSVGGATAVDFGTTFGNYGIDSPGVLAGLGNLPRFTLAGWLNNRSTTAGSGGNRVLRNFVSGAHGIDLVYRNDGSLDLGVNAFPNSAARSSGNRIPASAAAAVGNWRFFAVTYDSTLASGQVRFFFGSATLDAALDVTRNYAAGPVGPNVGTLSVGHVNLPARTGSLDRMFRGLVDEVAIFGTVLTPPEIISLQRGTAPLPRLEPEDPTRLLHPIGGLSIDVTDGMARLFWPTDEGQLYQIEYLDHLEADLWQVLMPEYPGTGSPGVLEEKIQDSPQRFYRVLRLGLP